MPSVREALQEWELDPVSADKGETFWRLAFDGALPAGRHEVIRRFMSAKSYTDKPCQACGPIGRVCSGCGKAWPGRGWGMGVLDEDGAALGECSCSSMGSKMCARCEGTGREPRARLPALWLMARLERIRRRIAAHRGSDEDSARDLVDRFGIAELFRVLQVAAPALDALLVSLSRVGVMSGVCKLCGENVEIHPMARMPKIALGVVYIDYKEGDTGCNYVERPSPLSCPWPKEER